MRITVLAVGKTDISWVREGLEEYISRLSHYVPFTFKELPALKGTASLSRAQIKEKEGVMILSELKPSDDVILLDEHGRGFTSIEFSQYIQRRMSAGRNVVFVIGGAYGFSQAVYDRSVGMISLSGMTFSHQMIRVIFTEQLYSAFTIIAGEPYHHE